MVNDWQAALTKGEALLQACEDAPEEASEYAESVSGTVSEIMETIERTKRATDRQIIAIENMQDGINRWVDQGFRDDEIPF